MKKTPAFTEEQIRILAENPYTRRVSECSLSFTPQFLRDACRMRADRIPYPQILREHGYDPQMIGERRMYHIGEIIKGKTPADFPDRPLPRSKIREFDQASDKRAMKQMQLEMKRMHQEIEFLKKIMATGIIDPEDD